MTKYLTICRGNGLDYKVDEGGYEHLSYPGRIRLRTCLLQQQGVYPGHLGIRALHGQRKRKHTHDHKGRKHALKDRETKYLQVGGVWTQSKT